jgi:hypothetical protein
VVRRKISYIPGEHRGYEETEVRRRSKRAANTNEKQSNEYMHKKRTLSKEKET